jgi:pimeloyl-ACP methyl ester carboxylesterase
MRVTGSRRRLDRMLSAMWLASICCVAGCSSPQVRDFEARAAGPAGPANSPPSLAIVHPPPGDVVVEAPRSQNPQALVSTPSNIETWIIHTRATDQSLGSDPWSSMTIGRLDEQGGPIHGTDPEALLARMNGRPSVFFIHGAGYTYKDAVDEAVEIRAVLEANGGLSPETLFIVFDWPSERERGDFIQDLNEQSRRSRVAAYHLARFLQTVPADSRITLVGQSNGGRIALMTLHLLSGAPLRPFWTEPAVALTSSRTDLRLRGVLLDTAAGHHWLDPGERLDQALPMCEALLNLRNCADYALSVYVVFTPARGPRWDRSVWLRATCAGLVRSPIASNRST